MAHMRPREDALTLGEAVQALAPGLGWTNLISWPPDVFAVAGAILADSGAYRVVVSPPEGLEWPPQVPIFNGGDWASLMRSWGEEWSRATAPSSTDPPIDRPVELDALAGLLDARASVALKDLGTAPTWEVTAAIVSLLALADEACAGLDPAVASAKERPFFTPFHFLARTWLAEQGSLSRLSTDRVRVLPKSRVPRSGMTVRSLSRYVAFERSEVAANWQAWKPGAKRPVAGRARAGRGGVADDHFTMLLVPWPYDTAPTDFRPCHGPLSNMDADRYRFFEYEPGQPFQPVHVQSLVSTAQARVGPVDAVVLPEAVLADSEARQLGKRLRDAGVPFLVAGSRRPAKAHGRLGANFAYVAGKQAPAQGDAQEIEQHKHHRWFLDRSQIEQYHLGASLDPTPVWWEAIELPPRRLAFLEIRDWLTVCPLICEDLARPDPVGNLLRAVAPSLVIALLLDGPQLESRWPGRYATALADDPGCAVLTLSSLGLVERARPPKKPISRVVGLWKDRHGLRELVLEPGAEGIALTVSIDRSEGTCADGRKERGHTTHAVLSGVESIRLPSSSSASQLPAQATSA